jgi:hypothetical protein
MHINTPVWIFIPALLLTMGGWPLFFLEYYRHKQNHKLAWAVLESVFSSIIVIWLGVIPLADIASGLIHHGGILEWPVTVMLFVAVWGTPWIFFAVWVIRRKKYEPT